MKNLLISLLMLLLVSCGINIPKNTKVGYSNNDYSSHLFTNEIVVQDWNAEENKETATYPVSEREIKYVNSVFKTIYDDVIIGDIVTKLDDLYKTHVTTIQYYSSKRVGNTIQIIFTWNEGNVVLSVPAVLSDDNSLMPLQVNKEVMESAKKFAKDSGANSKETEDIINDVTESFFNPLFSIKDRENISFKDLDNELKILKENSEKSDWDKLYKKYASDVYHYKEMSYYSGNSSNEDVQFYSILSLVKDLKTNGLNITVQNIIDRFENLTGLKSTKHFAMIGAQGFGNVLNIEYYDDNLKLTHYIEIVFDFIPAAYGEIISLQEVSILYKNRDYSGKDIMKFLYKDENYNSSSNIQEYNVSNNKYSEIEYYSKFDKTNNKYNGDFKKDTVEALKKRDKNAIIELTKIFREINDNYMIFAHYPESNVGIIYDEMNERFNGRYIYEYLFTKDGKLYYSIVVYPNKNDFENNRNQIAYFVGEIKVRNEKEGQDLFISYDSKILYKGPRSETIFQGIDAIDEALGNKYR
jgi:lipoprotein